MWGDILDRREQGVSVCRPQRSPNACALVGIQLADSAICDRNCIQLASRLSSRDADGNSNGSTIRRPGRPRLVGMRSIAYNREQVVPGAVRVCDSHLYTITGRQTDGRQAKS